MRPAVRGSRRRRSGSTSGRAAPTRASVEGEFADADAVAIAPLEGLDVGLVTLGWLAVLALSPTPDARGQDRRRPAPAAAAPAAAPRRRRPPPRRRRHPSRCSDGRSRRRARSASSCSASRSTSPPWSSGSSWSSGVSEAVPPALVEKLENAIKDRKFQEAYDACRDDDSFLARLVRTGIANLPNGRAEAKEAMNDDADEIVTGMEARISYLATIGTLGPMIGLVGTIWGMIQSFQEIATAAGSQPKPEKVAEGISTALFITLEGRLAVGPGDLLLRPVPQPDRPDRDGGHQGRRPHHHRLLTAAKQGKANVGAGVRAAAPTGPWTARRSRAMSGNVERHPGRAEPDAAARRGLPAHHVLHARDQLQPATTTTSGSTCRSPARPGRSRPAKAGEDRLVLNVDSQGHLFFNGQVLTPTRRSRRSSIQAQLVRLNAQGAPGEGRGRPEACRRRSSSVPTATPRSRSSTA